jgi:hypothetical protein
MRPRFVDRYLLRLASPSRRQHVQQRLSARVLADGRIQQRVQSVGHQVMRVLAASVCRRVGLGAADRRHRGD